MVSDRAVGKMCRSFAVKVLNEAFSTKLTFKGGKDRLTHPSQLTT